MKSIIWVWRTFELHKISSLTPLRFEEVDLFFYHLSWNIYLRTYIVIAGTNLTLHSTLIYVANQNSATS